MGFIAPFIPALFAGGAALGGVVALTGAMSKPKEPPAAPAPPPVPAVKDTQAEAAQQVINKRRQSLLAGGNVNPTGGMGAVLSTGEVKTKSLLGS